MCEWQSEVLGPLTSERQNLSNLLGGELGPDAAPVAILEHDHDELFQLLLARPGCFSRAETIASGLPTESPATHALIIDPKTIRERHCRQTRPRQKYDPRTNGQLLRCRLSPHDPLKNLYLTITHI